MWGPTQWGGAISAVNPRLRCGFRRGGFTPPRGLKSKGLPRGPCPVGYGMTDPFAVERFKELFIPMGWTLK